MTMRFVDHDVEAPYRHTTGPALSRFFTMLRDERVIAGRRCDPCDRVIVPPDEHCPVCGGALGEWVRVGPGGMVLGATVIARPMPLVGIDPPFAFVRVRLDGADTDFVHLAKDVARVTRGARVRAVWAPERTGTVRDILWFEPDRPSGSDAPGAADPSASSGEPVTWVATHLRLPYRFAVGDVEARFREGLRRGELAGTRCEACHAVYLPPRAFCPRCFAPCPEWLSLPDTGTVDAYVVVNVPFYGQEIEIPYVLAHVRIDGADATFFHLVGVRGPSGKLIAPPGGVRAGMRVEAVWRAAADRRGLFHDDIDHFRPVEG